MKRSKKAMLAAGLLAGAAAMTGCTSNTTAVATPTPDTAQQVTAQPEATMDTATQTDEPSETTDNADEGESPGPIALRVGDEEIEAGAVIEQDELLLPLEKTAEALGWKAESEKLEEETQIRRTVVLTKEDSQITVAWVVSDNTTRQITWQKDGLLIPVDTKITTIGEDVYVPAAFFETAMQVSVNIGQDEVTVTPPEPEDTPPDDADSAGNDS